MNVFHRFTRESLIRNRSRTLVTIVGIILSVALLTAVTEGAYSGVQFLRRSVEQRVGSFFGYFDNLTEGEASQLTQSHEVTKSTTWQDIGWAAIGSRNDYKPYLHVVSVDADFRSLVAVNLTSGRMPEKAGEILLPDHLLTNGDVSIPVGETITLDVGRRVYDGDTLDADISFAEGETLEDTRSRTYTVVGTYARFDYLIEDFGCPGYTALTCTENGGSVRAINAKGCGSFPRKKIDSLVEFVKTYKAKGLAWIVVNADGTIKSQIAKFFTPEKMQEIVDAMDGQPGDLILICADKDKVVFDSLGALRVELSKMLELTKPDDFAFLWITEFPMLEWDEEENRYVAVHHPFTAPMDEDLELIDTNPGAVRAKAYDIVLNGYELGGGSIRIHRRDIQKKMFELAGASTPRRCAGTLRLPFGCLQIRRTPSWRLGVRSGQNHHADEQCTQYS